MTRSNTFRILISSGAILAAIGCGDPSLNEGGILEERTGVGPYASGGDVSLEDELELACESSCDAIGACPGLYGTIDCVESCTGTYAVGAEAGDECTVAFIDLLNCYSALSCSTLTSDDAGECGDAVRGVGAACGSGELRARLADESELVAEIGDRVIVDADSGAEETSPADGSEDEEPEVIDITDPVVIVEIPDPVVIVDLPWIGVSDDD